MRANTPGSRLIATPNFVFSPPVRTNACVCAEIPVFTRSMTSTGASCDASAASRSSSSWLSITPNATRRSTIARNSSAVLPTPWKYMRPAGKPPRSAVTSSPSEQTSSRSGVAARCSASAPHRNALPA